MRATYTLSCNTEDAARMLTSNLTQTPGMESVSVKRDGDRVELKLDNPLICGLSRLFGTVAQAMQNIASRVLDTVRRPAAS